MLLMETEGENLLKTKEGKDIYMNLYVIQTMKKLSEIGPHPLFWEKDLSNFCGAEQH